MLPTVRQGSYLMGVYKDKSHKSYSNIVENWTSIYNRQDKKFKSISCILTIIIPIILILLLNIICYDRVLYICISCILISICGILYSFWLLCWIMSFDEGTVSMREVSDPIREGSEGFFSVQYVTIFRISILFAFLISMVYLFKAQPVTMITENTPDNVTVSSWLSALITGSCFLMGAYCSALSGYSGMWVSVRANIRTASTARRCYNEAIQMCFRGGAFSSVINVSLAVGGISTIILFLRIILPNVPLTQLPLHIVGYGFGASLVAMFAQLGGGIYTKGADVGADLVGKVEAGIPEDDPRNPATIADLVGDNVGDCAGQCADVFESIAAEIVAAMILGGSLAESSGMSRKTATGFVLFPLAVHCMDLVISSAGVLMVRTKPGMPDLDSAHGSYEDPLAVMKRAYLVTVIMGSICFTVLCRSFLYFEEYPTCWYLYSMCGGVGMICAYGFLIITQYYTDYEYSKVRRIAEASMTGPATNVIAGLSVGFESTALPVLLISFGVIVSYMLGQSSGIAEGKHIAGIFGTAVATMGMLCTAVFVLSMSSFGPIADNAGGIVEMSQQSESVRAITDRLDAVGNVTKANTKGFSVGSASLACFLLFSAFLDEVTIYSGEEFAVVDIAVPEVFVGGLLGSMLVFLFAGWAMEAVGRAAQEVVKEVRRQFSENPGIMDFQTKPDYATCVAIVSAAALREMIKPGLLSVLSPIAVGLFFRALGEYQGKRLLGAQVLASFLMFSTCTGILMALMLNNGGGAWDNAKKYVETGALGGKGSDCHKAAVVGDTVGDPCKDTAGPSIHVLIKLLSTVTMVLTPLFVGSVSSELN
eukprot:GHVL01042767.1.p1 GENE.GHVL01042767.1~~GHVL01042767.1.p1  ORF type:complete len:820 (-),score=120.10 GHVL01042767.1:1300-3759(-)